MIEAAGGVVWRMTNEGRVEVVLVHRPRRGDWSLPKGKLRRRESAQAAAQREVLEETGLVCELGPEVATSEYRDRKDRPKRVRYFAAEALSGRFRRNAEVDQIRWVPLADAPRHLSYARDALVLAAFVDVLVSSG